MFTFPRLDTFISYGNRFSTRLLIYRTLWHHNKIIFRFWLISTISLVSIDLKKTTENQLIARWMIQMVFHLCTRVALDIRLLIFMLIIKFNQYFVSCPCGATRTLIWLKIHGYWDGWRTSVESGKDWISIYIRRQCMETGSHMRKNFSCCWLRSRLNGRQLQSNEWWFYWLFPVTVTRDNQSNCCCRYLEWPVKFLFFFPHQFHSIGFLSTSIYWFPSQLNSIDQGHYRIF